MPRPNPKDNQNTLSACTDGNDGNGDGGNGHGHGGSGGKDIYPDASKTSVTCSGLVRPRPQSSQPKAAPRPL